MVEHLPLIQGMIPGSWDGVPHQVPCREPASPSAYVSVSLSLFLMNFLKMYVITNNSSLNLFFFVSLTGYKVDKPSIGQKSLITKRCLLFI